MSDTERLAKRLFRAGGRTPAIPWREAKEWMMPLAEEVEKIVSERCADYAKCAAVIDASKALWLANRDRWRGNTLDARRRVELARKAHIIAVDAYLADRQ